MKITQVIYASNRNEWRKWLKNNYKNSSEIWFIFYKKHSQKKSISYNDAVEEALCFGWIDSIEKRIDEEKYALRFSPRNPKTPYSQTNVERLKKLIKEKQVLPEVIDIISKQFPKVLET